jgi:hypothetical protein
MQTDDLLCSRNARSKTPLVGRAQWKINQSSSLKRQRASSEGAGISLDARLCGLTGIVLKSRMPMFSSGERSEMRREDRSQGMATAVSIQLVHIRRPQCR